MISNIEKYKKDLTRLIDHGVKLLNAMQYSQLPDQFREQAKKAFKTKKESDAFIDKLPIFTADYQTWYSEALVLIKQLLPDRVSDFIKYYEKPKMRKEITYENYVIEDYLQGLTITRGYNKDVVVSPTAAFPKFTQQLNFLKAVERRFESSLFDIKQLVQADLFDSELGSAKELTRHKFVRAAGAIAGVVLEKHLSQVASNHNLKSAKKHPTINDFNELLKNNEIIDTAKWRFIQHLGDIRNMCDHNKEKEPTVDEVNDLIFGVDKVIKTTF
jgi:hypothetical protein